MTRSLDDVLDDFQAAWNEPESDQRQARLARAWADDGIYCAPGSRIEGRDNLLVHLGEELPQRGGRFQISGEPDVVDGRVTFDTATKSPDGRTLARQVAFAELGADGKIKQLTIFPAALTQERSWIRDWLRWATESPGNLIQFVGILGGALYILLRVSVGIFYGALNVTPEEAGLDEVQMLRESVVMVVVYLIVAAVWSLLIATIILAGRFTFYPLTSHINALRRHERALRMLAAGVGLFLMAVPLLLVVFYLLSSREVRSLWFVLLILAPVTTLASAVVAVLLYESPRTVAGEAKGRVRTVFADRLGTRIFAFGMGIFVLITLVAFPISAWVRARDVRDGEAIDGRFEPWQAQRADVMWKIDPGPYALPGCDALRYLGSASGTVLLFDSNTDLTYRVATNDAVVRTQPAGGCRASPSDQSGAPEG